MTNRAKRHHFLFALLRKLSKKFLWKEFYLLTSLRALTAETREQCNRTIWKVRRRHAEPIDSSNDTFLIPLVPGRYIQLHTAHDSVSRKTPGHVTKARDPVRRPPKDRRGAGTTLEHECAGRRSRFGSGRFNLASRSIRSGTRTDKDSSEAECRKFFCRSDKIVRN